MNKRQEKKHWLSVPCCINFIKLGRHNFAKRKTKNRKRWNVHNLREQYKSGEYYHSWFDYDEDTGEYYEHPEYAYRRI